LLESLYVVGGQQRELRPLTATDGWYEYQKAIVLDLDIRSQSATKVIEYVSPPEATPEEGATILFKSGTLVGDRLFVCTQTEILIYCVPGFQRDGYISLPEFNDVHHVLPTSRGTLLVADTGLDTVLELSMAGDVLQRWNVLGEDPWARFSPEIDYRRVRTTKPHLAHPNYVFSVGDDVWATRFEQRDAICLTTPGRRIDIGIERVHDGVMHEGLVYFTTVDGHIVIADPERCEVVEVIDLKTMHSGEYQLGWCRSVAIDGDRIWVGFSRIRPTKIRENVGWVMRGFKRDFGTHLACYDLKKRECVSEILVEPFGLSAIFGIFPGRKAVESQLATVA
jgi:hypothetical protein